MCSNKRKIGEQDVDLWSDYKKKIKDVLACDIVPVVNDAAISVTSRTRLVYDDAQIHSYEHMSDVHMQYIERYLDSCTIVSNKNYTVSNHTRREKRRMSTGIKLDLHSCTLADLPNQLKYFCTRCIDQNEREAVIITGKGSGKIKNATEMWFNDNPSIILKYSPIYDALHEVGSFYVWVRKNGVIFRYK